MKNMLPTYKDHHKQQKLEMKGSDLAMKCQKDILMCTSETPLDQIKAIGQLHFEV